MTSPSHADSPSDAPPRVAIVIPVYNHAPRVRAVVEQALKTPYPVYVVDDGSTDGSADTLADLPAVSLLRHPSNRGKGAAILTGFQAVRSVADSAITLDADGQHDPSDIPQLVEALPRGERPIVVGCRAGMDGPHTPWTSRFGRSFSNFWVYLSGGHRVADSQSGFRLYPLPETLQLDVRARRYQFEVEVLVRAKWKGTPVRQATVEVTYPPGDARISHFRPFVDFWRNTRVFTRLIILRILLPRRVRARRLDDQRRPE